MLVRIFARTHVGQTLVRHRPLARIAANAQNLGPRPHRAVRRIVQNIALEGSWRLLGKPRLAKLILQLAYVLNAKFDFCFDGHRKERVYARSGNGFKRRQ